MLLMLVLDFMIKPRGKILKGISVEYMECLNEDAKKTIKLLLVLNCLIVKYKFCGVGGNLIETIT